MNVNKVLTKDYENERLHKGWKNKAKQTQFLTQKTHHFFIMLDNSSFN